MAITYGNSIEKQSDTIWNTLLCTYRMKKYYRELTTCLIIWLIYDKQVNWLVI
jgi:hypothetical protein